MTSSDIYWGRTAGNFLLVLLAMPLGHALMIMMEHYLPTTALHYCAFFMGAIGLAVVVGGVFVKNPSKATVFGFSGGLLFWTGWVEFLFSYYAWRYGVHYDLLGTGIVESATEYVDGIAVNHSAMINGESLDSLTREELKSLRGSRPEYLIMPATFGMWMMMVTMYLFCTRTGCRFFCWMQEKMHIGKKVALRPVAYLPSIVTFMELNMMMWSLYLLLMFCYDPEFLGSRHIVTFMIGIGCLIGSIFMVRKQLRIKPWGANLRMAIATVLVFWTFVEIMGRNGILKEIWVDPLSYSLEIGVMAVLFVSAAVWLKVTH